MTKHDIVLKVVDIIEHITEAGQGLSELDFDEFEDMKQVLYRIGNDLVDLVEGLKKDELESQRIEKLHADEIDEIKGLI